MCVYIVCVVNNADITPLRFSLVFDEAKQLQEKLEGSSIVRMTDGKTGYEVYIYYSEQWVNYVDFHMGNW